MTRLQLAAQAYLTANAANQAAIAAQALAQIAFDTAVAQYGIARMGGDPTTIANAAQVVLTKNAALAAAIQLTASTSAALAAAVAEFGAALAEDIANGGGNNPPPPPPPP